MLFKSFLIQLIFRKIKYFTLQVVAHGHTQDLFALQLSVGYDTISLSLSTIRFCLAVSEEGEGGGGGRGIVEKKEGKGVISQVTRIWEASLSLYLGLELSDNEVACLATVRTKWGTVQQLLQ